MSAPVTSAPATADLVRARLRGRRASPVEAIVAGVLLLALLSSLVVLVTLLADLVVKALPVFAERGLALVTTPLSPAPERTGILQGVMGSLALTVLVVVVAFPLGIAAAVYLEEYARQGRLARIVDANIRNLAGVPSIVYGILGLYLFVGVLQRGLFGMTDGMAGRNLLAGGLTLAVLVLPIMIITTAEALRAVPRELRQASLAVGATQWETIRHHVLPAALPAILTGSVLTLARAFGETAPLLLAGAQLSLFFAVSRDAGFLELVVEEPYTALPVVIYNFARQPGAEWVSLTAAAIVVLLVMLLTVNAAAILARDRFERRP